MARETPDAANGPKGRGEREELVFGELCGEAVYIDIRGFVVDVVGGWICLGGGVGGEVGEIHIMMSGSGMGKILGGVDVVEVDGRWSVGDRGGRQGR